MKENKMYLINKIFNDETIRTLWDNEKEKYYISVVDMVSILSESKDGRKYWNKLKQRLKEEGNETVTNCHQLKLKAQDGKYRMTDVCDIEGIFRIIESVPSKNAEPIKLWLARLGKERIDEVFDPSLTVQKAIDIYRSKGYDEDWIVKRIKGIQDRKKLTDVWKDNGVTEETEYAILTNEIYKEWSGLTSKEYKRHKGLRKESLRDNMTDIEVALADLGEIATRELASKHKPQGLEQNKEVAKMGGHAAKVARDDIEKNLGETIVSDKNLLKYKHDDNSKQIETNKTKGVTIMIDLHMHTTYSDGTDSIEEILINATKANLEIISITDHNTCKAYYEMENMDIDSIYKGDIILGCEFTTTFDNRLIEVLGYGFDYKKVQKFLDKYYSKELVKERTKTLYNRLINKIKDLDLTFNLEPFNDEKFEKEFFEFEVYMEIIKYPENKDKVKEDILGTFSDFYRKGLANPKSYFFINHVEFKPSLEKIIDLIHSAGGKAFLAHPYQYKFSDTEEFLDNIYNSNNLDGIECYYTRFTDEQTKYVLEFAKRRKLLISGGSDYHGKNKTNHDLGVGRGNLNISKNIVSNWNVDYYKKSN